MFRSLLVLILAIAVSSAARKYLIKLDLPKSIFLEYIGVYFSFSQSRKPHSRRKKCISRGSSLPSITTLLGLNIPFCWWCFSKYPLRCYWSLQFTWSCCKFNKYRAWNSKSRYRSCQ